MVNLYAFPRFYTDVVEIKQLLALTAVRLEQKKRLHCCRRIDTIIISLTNQIFKTSVMAREAKAHIDQFLKNKASNPLMYFYILILYVL